MMISLNLVKEIILARLVGQYGANRVFYSVAPKGEKPDNWFIVFHLLDSVDDITMSDRGDFLRVQFSVFDHREGSSRIVDDLIREIKELFWEQDLFQGTDLYFVSCQQEIDIPARWNDVDRCWQGIIRFRYNLKFRLFIPPKN